MTTKVVDYSLYLVTDSTSAVLGSKDLLTVVKAAIEGGMYSLGVDFTMYLHSTHVRQV